jgi:hypothetical protein
MNRETRAFILFFLTPGKIKIYLIILIIFAIYALYYRYSVQKSSAELVESFHNKNLKANPYKQNESSKDEDSIIEPDMRASQYAGETINNNQHKINNNDNDNNMVTNKKLKKLIIDEFINTDEPINTKKARQTDNTRYKEEIAKTYKELALAEDAKLQAYNRAFNNYIETQRLNKLNVNIADLGNSIEGGILDILQNINTTKYTDTDTDTEKLKNKGSTKLKTSEFVSPSISTGAEDVIESFISTNNAKTTSESESESESTSENILLYMLEVVSNFITNFDTSKITYYLQNYNDIINILTREENLIPAGVLMVIISMSLYFIDITS